MRRLEVLAVLAAAVAAALPGVATAAPPFAVGQGGPPQIVVGPDGRGHVAWGVAQQGAQPARIGYCRLPVGADACDVVKTLDFPAAGDVPAADPPQLALSVPSASKVVISWSCTACGGVATPFARIYALTSTDGGATFSPPVFLGSTPTAAGTQGGGLWLDGPGLLLTPGEGTAALVAAPGTDVTPAVPVVDPGVVYNPSIAAVPGSDKLVFAANDLGRVEFAVFRGPLTAAGLADPAAWLTGQQLTGPEGDSTGTLLTSGPSGLWLAYQRTVPGQDQVRVRQFDPAAGSFGPPSVVPRDDGIDAAIDGPDVSADGSGRLHVVWRSAAGSGQLRYTSSGTAGTGFAAPASIATGEDFADPDVGAATDGHGWAVWHTTAGAVRGVRLDTSAPGATTVTDGAVPGATLGFAVPRGCVQPGATFRVTLTWKRQKRKGNVFVKVTRADFYIGAKVVKSDRRAPFVQTLKVVATAKRGSTITLRARAFIKVRSGKAPKKSIRSKIKVCA